MADDLSFDVTAHDDASEVVDKVARAADQLDGTDVELGVDADAGDAESALEGVEAAADDLDGRTAEVTATADTGSAEARLASLEAAADRTDAGMRRLEQGSKVGGNAVADLAGPFGQAEGAASTAGGVFDGLGDIVEGIGPKFGLSTAAAEKAAMALGLVGIAAAAGAAIWNAYSESQKKAKQALKDTAEAQAKVADLMSKGDVAGAAEAQADAFEKSGLDIVAMADHMGASVGATYDYITGKTDTVVGATEGVSAQAFLVRQHQDEAAEAGKRMGKAEEELAEKLAQQARASEHVIEVEKAMTDARRGAADASIAYGDALVGVGDAHAATAAAADAMNAAIANAGAGSTAAAEATRAYDDAVRSERDAQIDAAAAAGELAAQQAAASGSTDTAKAETDAYNRSLLTSAATTTGPVQAALINHIATLNGIPPEKVSAIIATTPNLEEQKRLLDDAARTRTATINVDFIPQLDRLENAYRSGAAPRPSAAGASAGGASVGLRAGAPAAAFVAPGPAASVTVRVDARGAADPYAVGRSIRENLDAWARVSGRFRPGQGLGP